MYISKKYFYLTFVGLQSSLVNVDPALKHKNSEERIFKFVIQCKTIPV